MRVELSPCGTKLLCFTREDHSVALPPDARAAAFLFNVLREQALQTHRALGSATAPLQSMVDDFLRKGGRVQVVVPKGPRVKVEICLEDLFL